jgi:riboflavin-specific deaminase-like protein
VAAQPRSGSSLQLRQLLPEPRTLTVGALLSTLDLLYGAPADRPRTVANFVATVDGRAAFQGRSGPLSDDADRALFHGLRERVDAVLVGTGTLRVERYGRLVGDRERRLWRTESGLSPEPLACVISRSGEVPTDIPLFAEPEARIVIFTSEQLDLSRCTAHVDLFRLDPGELTLTTMLRRLRSEYDVRALLCEGGPTLFGAMLEENLVDELFLTLAPKLSGGGSGPSVSQGSELAELHPLKTIWALERDGSLFLRYSLR